MADKPDVKPFGKATLAQLLEESKRLREQSLELQNDQRKSTEKSHAPKGKLLKKK